MTTSPTPVLDTPDASTIDNADPAIDLPAETPPEPGLPALRILKIANCGSLSGRSTLTYHIGILNSDTNASAGSESTADIQLRLFHNTAKGYFCKDWVSMALIYLLLSEANIFSSGDVQRLFFQGKSVNSGGFVLAALRHEGLIRTSEGSLRSYERLDPTAWQEEIAALIEAGVSLSELQVPEVPVVVAKKGKSAKALASKGLQPTKKKPA